MQAAALCAQSLSSELTYKPTLQQQADNFGVPTNYVNLMLRLTPAKRARIAGGEDKTSYLVLVRALHQVEKNFAEIAEAKAKVTAESFRSLWEKSHPNWKVNLK
jgi:hypothetical protein